MQIRLTTLKINTFFNLNNKKNVKIVMLTATLYLTFKSNLDGDFKKYGISKIDYILNQFHIQNFHLIMVSNRIPLCQREVFLKFKNLSRTLKLSSFSLAFLSNWYQNP